VVQIIRYGTVERSNAFVGVLDDAGMIARLPGVESLAELWRLDGAVLQQLLASAHQPLVSLADVVILPPIDADTEVWACGVTYSVSQDARMEESERSATVYEHVYDAERPELFFKSMAWRAVGHGEPIAIRSDSDIDVPEPEVALVVNAFGEIVGYTICNDVSSRTIEGQNPLYLPQAKNYLGACAVGPAITPAWEVPDPYALSIVMLIRRDGGVVWDGSASTAQLHRRFDELVGFLLRADYFPDGAILSTGTCLVPASPFSLRSGDEVSIEVDQLGHLTNTVVQGAREMAWLVESRSDIRSRPGYSAAFSQQSP
jgi:2-dehydro-3-deoxy-D-arabinonate dehydratase